VNPFQSLREYEEYVYGLSHGSALIESSSLVVVRRGALRVIVHGELRLRGGYRLVIEEHLTLEHGPLRIDRYGYEAYQGAEKRYWYDSQPHPHLPELAVTHPHHKHVPPDIKHNRIPAPGLSFTQPNLPFLIQEIEQLLQQALNADQAV
jgi:hypothetical protein